MPGLSPDVAQQLMLGGASGMGGGFGAGGNNPFAGSNFGSPGPVYGGNSFLGTNVNTMFQPMQQAHASDFQPQYSPLPQQPQQNQSVGMGAGAQTPTFASWFQNFLQQIMGGGGMGGFTQGFGAPNAPRSSMPGIRSNAVDGGSAPQQPQLPQQPLPPQGGNLRFGQ